VSLSYQAVGWNRQKKIYDAIVIAGSLSFLTIFVLVSWSTQPSHTIETAIIRAFGTLAFVLLHLVLIIGPLARLDHRFLPLLYNRRHLGVMMCLFALVHGAFGIFQFHTLGNINPLVSVLTGDGSYDSLGRFPFQPWGLAALGILLVMAATSHDFWLANLTPPVWKTIHMLVYLAYGFLIVHVAFGVLQSEFSPVYVVAVGSGLALVVGLHLAAGWSGIELDRETAIQTTEGFVDVCAVGDMSDNRARTASVAGERVAIFRYDGKISAVSNLCQHQNGPLGEGRIIDGCITCPWHGFQYQPDNGRAPAPFEDRIPTFDVRLDGDRVLVGMKPHPPGTPVAPAVIPSGLEKADIGSD